MATQTRPDQAPVDELLRVIASGNPSARGITKMRAIAALRGSASRKKRDVFLGILAESDEPPRFKHMAIMGLYELGGDEAREALRVASRIASAETAATVALGLGRIGSPRDADLIDTMAAVAAPHARSWVHFAGSLLAYRHGLEGHLVTAPSGRRMLALAPDDDQQGITVEPSDPSRTDQALEALRREPIDIALTGKGALSLECPPNNFTFVWSESMVNASATALAKRKSVLGVITRKSRFTEQHSLSAVVLATPLARGTRLTVHRADTGDVLYSGSVSTRGRVSLRTVRRPGAVPIAFSGSIQNDLVAIEQARSGVRTPIQRVPRLG